MAADIDIVEERVSQKAVEPVPHPAATQEIAPAKAPKTVKVGQQHPIGDSADYLEEAHLEDCACPCGGEVFEIAAGVSLYQDSEDVRWFYVGCRCPSCGLTACYGDWKNEYNDYRELLASV